MYNWYAVSQLGKLTVEERVAWAEKQRRFPPFRIRKSWLSRLSTLIRRQKVSEQEHSALSGKPATSRST